MNKAENKTGNVPKKRKTLFYKTGIAGIAVILVLLAIRWFQIDETEAWEKAEAYAPADAEYLGMKKQEKALVKRYVYTYAAGTDYLKFTVDGFGNITEEKPAEDTEDDKTLAQIYLSHDGEAMAEAAVTEEEAERIALKNSPLNSVVEGCGYRTSSGYGYYDIVIKSEDGNYRVMINGENGEVLWNEKI